MILVVGVPRSGTSAVAGVLHHLGVDMGKSSSANEWNPSGYYHDMAFEQIISKLLKYPWPKFNNFVDCPAITELAKSKTGLWGFKSNRIVYCLPSLLAGVDSIKIITTSRPLEQSINSYMTRSRCSLEFSTTQINNAANAINTVIKSPDLTVPYHALIDDTTNWVSQIAEVVGLPVKQEAVNWIDSKLRRFI